MPSESTDDTKNTDAKAAEAPVADATRQETVTLDTPIQRGSKTVAEITLRKPLSGALRGVSLADVLNMDVAVLTRVLPRISEPALTEAEIRNMDPADLVQLASTLSGFLLTKRMRAEAET